MRSQPTCSIAAAISSRAIAIVSLPRLTAITKREVSGNTPRDSYNAGPLVGGVSRLRGARKRRALTRWFGRCLRSGKPELNDQRWPHKVGWHRHRHRHQSLTGLSTSSNAGALGS
jgi:hypothetical protein